MEVEISTPEVREVCSAHEQHCKKECSRPHSKQEDEEDQSLVKEALLPRIKDSTIEQQDAYLDRSQRQWTKPQIDPFNLITLLLPDTAQIVHYVPGWQA